MVHLFICPRCGAGMAAVAVLCTDDGGRDVIERLARCLAAVVASSAARDEHGVIDLGTEKTDGVLVASLTGCCSGYMAG